MGRRLLFSWGFPAVRVCMSSPTLVGRRHRKLPEGRSQNRPCGVDLGQGGAPFLTSGTPGDRVGCPGQAATASSQTYAIGLTIPSG